MANIQKLLVNNLVNWDRNPREISDKDYSKLLEFVEKYPDQIVLLVDGRDKKTVLGGNMRLRAIKEKGWEAVDCNIVKVEDDKEAFERAMIDNSQFGKYVMEQVVKLQEEFHIDESIKIGTATITIKEILPMDKTKVGEEKVDSEEEQTKTLVLKFSEEQHERCLSLLDVVRKKKKLVSNEEIFLFLLEDAS